MIEQPPSHPAVSISRPGGKGGLLATLALVGGIGTLIGLTVSLTVIANGNVAAALAPLLVVALLYAIWKAPLRVTLYVLMFGALTLENPYSVFAAGQYKSPLFSVGALLLGNLWLVTGVQALHFTGLDCLTACLLLIVLYRRATGSTIDSRGQLETASPMGVFAWVAFLSILVFWAYGLALGGSWSNSLWQVQKLVYLPIIFFLFQAALRGPADYGPLVVVLIAAALVRSVVAILIRTYFHLDNGLDLPVATNHEDSLLFASTFAVLVAGLLEQPNRKRFLTCLAILPVLGWGMVANTRRLVWVEIAAVLIAYLLISSRSELKRWVKRAALRALPLVLVYGAVGWRSNHQIFAPIQALRSVSDTEQDVSAQWREHENFNLIYTLADHPWFGSGFGHQYTEAWHLEDISASYPQYRYNPHNSVLALLNSAGLLGFAGWWTLFVTGVFLAVRSYHRARHPDDRSAALSAVGIVLIYLIQGYGDIGLAQWTSVLILSPMLAIVGKLAVLTGAWPGRRPAPLRQEKA